MNLRVYMEDALRRQSVLSEPKLEATNDATTPDVQFVALVNRQSGFIFRIAIPYSATLRMPKTSFRKSFSSFTVVGVA